MFRGFTDEVQRAKLDTCEDSGRIVSVPDEVEPVVVPAPLAIFPVQVEDIAITNRVAQNGPIKEDICSISFGLLFPGLGNQ